MKRKPTAPRNPFVAAALFKKAGAHDKPNKAKRRAETVTFQRALNSDGQSSGLLIRLSRVRFSQRPPPDAYIRMTIVTPQSLSELRTSDASFVL